MLVVEGKEKWWILQEVSRGGSSEHENLNCPKINEEGNKDSNRGQVPQLVVEGEKHDKGRTYLLWPRSLSKSKKKNGNCNSPIFLSDDKESDYEECKSSFEEDCEVDDLVKMLLYKKDSDLKILN